MRPCTRLAFALLCACSTMTARASGDEVDGLWRTAAKDGVIQVASCADKPGAKCATVVWDAEANAPNNTCGLRVLELNGFERNAWRDGWVFDPRDQKRYRGTLRVKGGVLEIRAYIGVEALGETERMTRVNSLPTAPTCKKP